MDPRGGPQFPRNKMALGAKEEVPEDEKLLELLLMFLGIVFSFPDSVSQYLFAKSVIRALHFHVDSQSSLSHPQISPSPSLSSAKLLLQILKGAAIFRFRAYRKIHVWLVSNLRVLHHVKAGARNFYGSWTWRYYNSLRNLALS